MFTLLRRDSSNNSRRIMTSADFCRQETGVTTMTNPLKVLLVEDDEFDERMFRQLVRRSDELSCEVVIASTLQLALQNSEQSPPDLVVLDLNLPDSRGITTFQKLHESFPGPILIYSGTTDLALTQLALKQGAQDFLVKGEADTIRLSRAMLFAAERGKRLEVERSLASRNRELNLLFQVHEMLLPELSAHQFPGGSAAAAVFPAERASGDYCDLLPLDDSRLLCCVADVSGHGLRASQLMLTARATFRALATTIHDPAELMIAAGDLLGRDFPLGSFVTTFLAVIDSEAGSMTYCAAGHEGFLIRAADADVISLSPQTVPIGLMHLANLDAPETQTVQLNRGDVLFVPTDGVFEAMRGDEAIYGQQRMLQRITELRDLSPEDLIRKMCATIREFCAGTPLADDMTMVCAKPIH
jgi:serine phosphatase RsbU (regulator of sigma subunit)